MYVGNIGDNSTVSYLVPVHVPSGGTVTVTNKAGAAVMHRQGHHDNAAGTLTTGQSQSYTAPFFLNTAGITTITLVGPDY